MLLSVACAIEAQTQILYVCKKCDKHSWEKPESDNWKRCCGEKVREIKLRKPFKLQNEALEMQFCGGMNFERYCPVYSTTIYNHAGDVVGLHKDTFKKLDEDILKEDSDP